MTRTVIIEFFKHDACQYCPPARKILERVMEEFKDRVDFKYLVLDVTDPANRKQAVFYLKKAGIGASVIIPLTVVNGECVIPAYPKDYGERLRRVISDLVG